MIRIYPPTHRQVASAICESISESYAIELNREKFLWGSIAPDFLPYYKFKRHYLDESIDFISKEIYKLIILCRLVRFRENSEMTWKLFSRMLGIISHYLMDFCCYPHAYRMTFNSFSAREHIQYELDLNSFVKGHSFREEMLSPIGFEIDSNRENIKIIKEYILYVVEEYKSGSPSFERDLDFAYSLCLKVTEFILDNVFSHVSETEFSYI